MIALVPRSFWLTAQLGRGRLAELGGYRRSGRRLCAQGFGSEDREPQSAASRCRASVFERAGWREHFGGRNMLA